MTDRPPSWWKRGSGCVGPRDAVKERLTVRVDKFGHHSFCKLENELYAYLVALQASRILKQNLSVLVCFISSEDLSWCLVARSSRLGASNF
jgi:hypothetical protein